MTEVPKYQTNIIVDTKEPSMMKERIMRNQDLYPEFEDLASIGGGDYIIGDELWERKTTSDFLGSVRDRRIWDQLSAMLAHGKKCGIIIEGSWFNAMKRAKFTYNQRNGILNAITLEYGVPIVYTSSQKKTVEFLTKRAKAYAGDVKKKLHAVREKGLKSKSMDYKQRYVLEGFPGIGASTSDTLLRRMNCLSNVLDMILDPSNWFCDRLTTKQRNEINTLLSHPYGVDKSG